MALLAFALASCRGDRTPPPDPTPAPSVPEQLRPPTIHVGPTVRTPLALKGARQWLPLADGGVVVAEDTLPFRIRCFGADMRERWRLELTAFESNVASNGTKVLDFVESEGAVWFVLEYFVPLEMGGIAYRPKSGPDVASWPNRMVVSVDLVTGRVRAASSSTPFSSLADARMAASGDSIYLAMRGHAPDRTPEDLSERVSLERLAPDATTMWAVSTQVTVASTANLEIAADSTRVVLVASSAEDVTIGNQRAAVTRVRMRGSQLWRAIISPEGVVKDVRVLPTGEDDNSIAVAMTHSGETYAIDGRRPHVVVSRPSGARSIPLPCPQASCEDASAITLGRYVLVSIFGSIRTRIRSFVLVDDSGDFVAERLVRGDPPYVFRVVPRSPSTVWLFSLDVESLDMTEVELTTSTSRAQ
jgi:hypothetical protein